VKSRSKKKKSTTATFWEAIFLVKSHLHEPSLTEKREREREKEMVKRE
jgi:hypothetical protein